MTAFLNNKYESIKHPNRFKSSDIFAKDCVESNKKYYPMKNENAGNIGIRVVGKGSWKEREVGKF